MKFIKAIKAMGPGQLLCHKDGGKFEIVDSVIRGFEDGRRVGSLCELYADSWRIENKPRPRVRFDAAMRAALEGKVIRSYATNCSMAFEGSRLVSVVSCGSPTCLDRDEIGGDWEILEPAEGDK